MRDAHPGKPFIKPFIVGRAAVPAIDARASAPTLTDEWRWVWLGP